MDRSRRNEKKARKLAKSRARAIEARRTMPDPFVEEFRLLAMNVMALLEDAPLKALTVFSHGSGDGRTLVAVELARALAAHTDVLLIDGQRNSGGMHESLLISGPSHGGQRPKIGVDLMPTDHRRLWLFSEGSRDVAADTDLPLKIARAAAAGMFVIVDAPASKLSSDAFVMAQRVQNVLYVMRDKPQDMAPHRRAMDHLRRLNTRVLGIVLNDR
jgi:Mrp family chromosome partitioning ATPase